MAFLDILSPITNTIDDIFFTNQEQSDNAVALAQAEAQLAAATAYDPYASSSNTTTYILIGLAVLAVGGLIYYLTRKK